MTKSNDLDLQQITDLYDRGLVAPNEVLAVVKKTVTVGQVGLRDSIQGVEGISVTGMGTSAGSHGTGISWTSPPAVGHVYETSSAFPAEVSGTFDRVDPSLMKTLTPKTRACAFHLLETVFEDPMDPHHRRVGYCSHCGAAVGMPAVVEDDVLVKLEHLLNNLEVDDATVDWVEGDPDSFLAESAELAAEVQRQLEAMNAKLLLMKAIKAKLGRRLIGGLDAA